MIIERNEGESEALKALLEAENEQFDIDVVNALNADQMPKTVDALRQFDQVILLNIANEDMPDGFVDLLYIYVNDIGGGLLTVGGNKQDENGNLVLQNGQIVPNAYNREDMYETLYPQRLQP